MESVRARTEEALPGRGDSHPRQAKRNDVDLVGETGQDGTRSNVISRRRDDPVDVAQKPVHQRSIELQQRLLLHDV